MCPAEYGGTAVVPQNLFGGPQGIGCAGRLQPQQPFGGEPPMCPGLDTRGMGRLHQRDVTFGKLMGKRMLEQLQFAATRAIEHDFYELANRPAMAGQGLVKLCKACGRRGAYRPGKLGGPPKGGMDEFRMLKQGRGAGHRGMQINRDTV